MNFAAAIADLCAKCSNGASGDCVAQQSLLRGSLPDEITHDVHGVLGCRLRKVAGPLIEIAQDARAPKPPCGECHLRTGETCDICGAKRV